MRSLLSIATVCLLSSLHSVKAQTPPVAQGVADPKPIPVKEYDSGVVMQMAAPWKRPGKDGTIWAIDGLPDRGEFVIRFPFAIEPAPASLDALYERELTALQKDRSWKKEKKSISNSALALTAPSQFQTLQLSIESTASSAAWTKRYLYIKTPEGKYLALNCALPTASVADDDPCSKTVRSLGFVPEAELLSARDRQRASDIEVPCSVVNGEIERFKAAYPGRAIKDMDRFTFANGLFMSMAMSGKNSSMNNVIALSKAYPDIVAATEKTCLERPEMIFSSALGEGIKSIPKPAP